MACATPRSPTASLPSPKQKGKSGSAVYVAAVPLKAAKGPSQTLMSAAYSLRVWDLQHFMVVIRPDPSHSQVTVFDFQPQDPENFSSVLAVLTQRPIPGVVLKRKMQSIPKTRCWFIGFSDIDGVFVADKFSDDWTTDLIVGKHDCRHFTNDARNLTLLLSWNGIFFGLPLPTLSHSRECYVEHWRPYIPPSIRLTITISPIA